MQLLLDILINAVAVFVTARLLPGVTLDGFSTAIVITIVLAIVNTFIKPILVLLTLPINIMTLGLFMFIVNAIIIILVDNLVSGFSVQSFGWALMFSLILSLVGSFLNSIAK